MVLVVLTDLTMFLICSYGLTRFTAKAGVETGLEGQDDAIVATASGDAPDVGLQNETDGQVDGQAVAQAKGWSLDEMRLDIDVLAGGTPGDGAGAGPDGVQTFLIKGLHLQGAGWGLGALSLSDDVRTPLATCRFRWRRETEAESGGGSGDGGAGGGAVSVPVYLNEGRTELLFQVALPAAGGVARATWRQRGVAVIAWV